MFNVKPSLGKKMWFLSGKDVFLPCLTRREARFMSQKGEKVFGINLTKSQLKEINQMQRSV